MADDTQDKKADVKEEVTKLENEVPLQHLIEEIELDTTPRKSMVAKVLGGDFTFLGQYEEEGTMVMVRRAQEDPDEGDILAENPHTLQPPLHRMKVRGDILLMRVANTEEDDSDDEEDYGVGGTAAEAKGDGCEENGATMNGNTEDTKGIDDNNNNVSEEAQTNDTVDSKSKGAKETTEAKAAEKNSSSPDDIHASTNSEFFLDYTKEEYLKFAARTDIVAQETSSSSEDEESEGEEAEGPQPSTAALLADANEDDEDSNDGDFDPDADPDDEDGEDDEEHQVGMMNLILGHMLRRFREEHGHGPDSLELLEMRKALADRLGVAVPPVDEGAWEDAENREKATPERKKKVVVDEERNETEEIPRRNTGEDEEEEEQEEQEEGESNDDGEHNEANEGVEGTASGKRTRQDGFDERECNDHKRPRINGENCGSSIKNEKNDS